MALIATKNTSTTSVSNPSETEFVMFASTFQRQLFFIDHLKLFYKRIKKFKSIKDDIHMCETTMTIQLYFLPRKIKFFFNNLDITITTKFQSNSTYVNNLCVHNTHFDNHGIFRLN
jgi:hypothetical protein